MKKLLAIILVATAASSTSAQDYNDLGTFSVSVTPSGFVFWGPGVNAELGIGGKVLLSARLALPKYGLMWYVLDEDWNELNTMSGLNLGFGGAFYFTKKRHKPYVGIAIDYIRRKGTYLEGFADEWTQDFNGIMAGVTGGYRFRFPGGFFLYTGAALGLYVNAWEWEYVDPSYGFGSDGSEIIPGGYIDIGVGFEF